MTNRRPAPRGNRRVAVAPRLLCAVVLACALSSCATYSERTAFGRSSVTEGAYDDAVDAFNDALKVSDRDELPKDHGSATSLILLERGMVSQAQGQFQASARDLGASDKRLEVLDIARDTTGELGKYLYSDSSANYRSSPVEKLGLNTMNMLNYLAEGDLGGARVEARRFTVMRDYLKNARDGDQKGTAGAYLSGFVFERLGDPNEALRYYDEALAAEDLPTLAPAIHRLAKINSYRGDHLAGFLSRNPAPPTASAAIPSEILTVVSLGRVPSKIPERMPIGLAVGIAGAEISGDPEVLGYAAFKVLVYPALAASESNFSGASVTIDGKPSTLELASDFAAEITEEYEEAKPKIIGAAVSRMIVRAAAAEGAREAGKQAGDAGAVVGWIAALATEATLVALDKPDTRSWTLLPGRVYVSRTVVVPGAHKVRVTLAGTTDEARNFDVEVPKGGFAAIVVTPLR
jgi:hypothetical protein